MPKLISKFGVPFFLALALHGLLFFLIDRNWSQNQELSSIVDFEAISARLIVAEPELPPQTTPKIETKAKSVSAAAESLDQPTKQVQPDLDVLEKDQNSRKMEEKKEAKTAARQRLLDELASSNLEAVLNQETSELERLDERQIAASFQANIYDQVRRKWRRPPSARNGMQTKLLVELIPTGEVVSVTIVESSGLLEFDRSAEQAVIRSGSFEVPEESRLFEGYFRNFFLLFRPEDLLR